MSRVLYILFSIAIISCSHDSNTATQTDLLQQITATEKGLMRGIDLGMSTKDVKTIEKTGLTEDDADYLFYEFLIDSTNSYTLAYSFENDSLTEIRADIYLANTSHSDSLVGSLQKYYTKKYQEPLNENNVLWIWDTQYNNEPIKIELADESADYNSGKLSVTIYKDTEFFN